MHTARDLFLTAAAGLAFAVPGRAQTPRPGTVPVIGGPCENCEAVFDGLPDTLRSTARIAPRDEPGEPLRIEGTVVDANGEPVPGVIVYAYHTNARGIYPRDDRDRGRPRYRHGLLRGWAVTDARGRYRFDTIRPGAYPNADEPQHVHMHVIEPACCTYYIASIHFEDDPRVTDRGLREGRGGSGLVLPRRADGAWRVTRDIVLGRGVPGYPEP